MTALKSLTLTAFRGSSQMLKLAFEKDRKLALIYGENGSGKTTICDAFEFLAKDNLGSLDGRGLGAALHKYWPSAGRTTAELAVELETAGGVCRGELQGGRVVIIPPALRPRVEILRRQQVLKLVEAVPGDRYKEVQRFIDIAGFERSEEALRQYAKALTTERVEASRAEQQALNTLVSSQEIAKAAGQGDPVSWARTEISKPAVDRLADIARIDCLRQALTKLKPYPETLRRLKAQLSARQEAADASDAEFIAAKSRIGDEAGRTLDVLTAGLAFLEQQTTVDACPLCESSDRAQGLTASVRERLDYYTAYRAVLKRSREDGEALSSGKAALATLQADFDRDAQAFATADVGAADLLAAPPPPPPSDVGALEGWLADIAPVAERWAELEGEWRTGARFAATLTQAVADYDDRKGRVEEIDARKPLAEAALEVCVLQRQAFTENVIAEIAKEVGELYDKVHPGEGLDKIALPLDPKKRASLELAASFGGTERPPQAYFSQSHLDTLGLCVFLALARRERPGETVLVPGATHEISCRSCMDFVGYPSRSWSM